MENENGSPVQGPAGLSDSGYGSDLIFGDLNSRPEITGFVSFATEAEKYLWLFQTLQEQEG